MEATAADSGLGGVLKEARIARKPVWITRVKRNNTGWLLTSPKKKDRWRRLG
jgi:hypothetical protein